MDWKDWVTLTATAIETLASVVDLYAIAGIARGLRTYIATTEVVLEALRNYELGFVRVPGAIYATGGAEIVFDPAFEMDAACFRCTRALMKGLSVALAVVLFARSLHDTIAGWHDQTTAQRVVSVVNVVVNAAIVGAALCELVGIAAAFTGWMAGAGVLPGIACGIIMLLLPPKHEPTPPEVYMQHHGKAFLASLPLPSAYYLERKEMLEAADVTVHLRSAPGVL